MTDQKQQPEVKTPSVVLSFKFASEEAQRRATKEGANFAVYLIGAGPWEGRHTFEPSSVRVPSTWTHVQTFEPEAPALEVGKVEIEEAEPVGALCEDCQAGLVLSADGSNHIFGEKVGDVRPCKAAASFEDVSRAMAVASSFAYAERATFIIYKVTAADGVTYKVRRESLKLDFDSLTQFGRRGKWEVAKKVERLKFEMFEMTGAPSEPRNPYPEGSTLSAEDLPIDLQLQDINARDGGFREAILLEVEGRADADVKRPSLCEACLRGVALDADGANHVVGGALDVKPCAAAFDVLIEGGNVGSAFAEAIAAAQRFANVERRPFVVYAAKTCYLVRRYTFSLPESLKASHAKLVEPLPSSTLPNCSFLPHVERDERSGIAKAIHSTCACGQWFSVVEDETLQTPEDELRRRAFADYAAHVGTVEPQVKGCDGEPKPFVVHATRGDVTTIVRGRRTVAMVCGKELQPTELFASVPTGANLKDCPGCKEAVVRASSGERFSFAFENYPDPARHELLTFFGKRIGGGDTAKIVSAFCTCGEWNFGFEVAEDLSDLSATEEARARHVELHLSKLAPADATKKELILRLYEEGVRDIAELVRRVKARPSYVAQVLQQAGHLEGFFDLYATTGREQNVYTRYFRNVLAFRNVEAARESVQKIDRLYNYFERLGDRAGQHTACLHALLGKNRARWSGKLEESNIFHEWLMTH
jgi:hypothetical protein